MIARHFILDANMRDITIVGVAETKFLDKNEMCQKPYNGSLSLHAFRTHSNTVIASIAPLGLEHALTRRFWFGNDQGD